MTWLLFALLAPLIYTVVNFIDKYLVSRVVKEHDAMPIYTSLAGFLAGTVFWVVTGFPKLALFDGLIVILTGILTAWSLIVYFKALAIEDTSNVILFFQMFPIISLVLSSLFLHEAITSIQLGGFVLVLVATILVSVKKKKKHFHFSKGFLLILVYDLLYALSGVLIKFAINANSFSKILSYESWGVGLGGFMVFIFFPSVRKAFRKNLKKIKKRAVGVIFLNESGFILAKSLTFLAFSLGAVALVAVLENTQIFYGIFLGYLLTKMIPKVFKENIEKKELLKKIFASVILFFGILLMK